MNKINEIEFAIDSLYMYAPRSYGSYKAIEFLREYKELLQQKSSQEFVKVD